MSMDTLKCNYGPVRKAVSLALGLAMGLSAMGLKAEAQPGYQPKSQTMAPATAGTAKQRYMADVLMLVAARNVTDDQLTEDFAHENCKLVETVGLGAYRILVIKTQKGKLEQAEKALRKNKHIWLMQRNYMADPNNITDANEPIIKFKKDGQGSFIKLVKADKAWQFGVSGAGQTIAVIDSGCQVGVTELPKSKCEKGYDGTTLDAKAALASSPVAAAVTGGVGLVPGLVVGVVANIGSDLGNPGVSVDIDEQNQFGQAENGHGTEVETVAAGSINGSHACGIAPDAKIYPIKGVDTLSICAGIWHLITTGGPKILNISRGPIANQSQNPITHILLALYHDTFGGITFLSAGNNGEDTGPAESYINVVSMTDTNGRFVDANLASTLGFPGQGSGHGSGITFAAQGVNVDTINRFDQDDPTGGTSVASPTCAGIAALVWQANPGLSNTQVEAIMKQHSHIPAGVTPDPTQYGYGIPNAAEAVQAALGGQ